MEDNVVVLNVNEDNITLVNNQLAANVKTPQLTPHSETSTTIKTICQLSRCRMFRA